MVFAVALVDGAAIPRYGSRRNIRPGQKNTLHPRRQVMGEQRNPLVPTGWEWLIPLGWLLAALFVIAAVMAQCNSSDLKYDYDDYDPSEVKHI